MFKELYDRLTMSEQQIADKKRFDALVKDFAKEFGLDEKKVSRSREMIYDVLYGGYNKKETTAYIRDSVMESTYGMVADIMDSVGDDELAENVKRGVKNYLNNDFQAIQQVNEVVYLAERAAYFDWYGKDKERDYYEERTANSEKKLMDITCKNLLEQVSELDMNMEEKVALKINSKSADSGISKEAETADKAEQLKRKCSLAKKTQNKSVEASRNGMGMEV